MRLKRPDICNFCCLINMDKWRIWGFHVCDFGECLLLGYKTPVRTLMETHYVSATHSSWLMLCKV
jgi:hypothetical protein